MNGKEVDGSRLVVQIAGDRRKEKFDTERKRGPQKTRSHTADLYEMIEMLFHKKL